MTRFLAGRHSRDWHWTPDTTGVVIYSLTAAVFILAWAYVPA